MSLEKFFETRRKTIELEGGIHAVVRTIDTREAFIAAGIVPGLQNMNQEQNVKVGRELVRLALVSLDGEADPIGVLLKINCRSHLEEKQKRVERTRNKTQ